MPDRPAVDFLAPQGSHLKRYSYSGFEESSEVEELSDLSLSHERSSPLPPRGPVVRHLLAQFRIPALAFHKSQVLLRLAGQSELLGKNLCQ